MDTREVLQFINLALALASVFPSFLILKKLISERKLVAIKDRKLNKALTAIFGGIVSLAVGNAVIAILALFGIGRLAHNLSPYGRLIMNTFFSIASWLIYLVDKEIERKK